MIIILISYFSIMKASIISEINLTIKGNGPQQILNEAYDVCFNMRKNKKFVDVIAPTF